MATAGEKHCRDRTRAAGTNYNSIVHVTSNILRILANTEMLADNPKFRL
jgi:hypothetical protein